MDAKLIQQTKNRMLIVDDDCINREILKNLFKDQFQCIEAENGREGLQKIEENLEHLAVILSDVNMPEMDGLEMIRTLKERNLLDQVPVFIITSNEEQALAESAYEIGVMGIINKPVVPVIALRRVQIVVELYRARDALNMRVRRQEKKLAENVKTIDALHRSTLEAMASAIEFRDVESGEHTNRIYGITRKILWDTEMGDDFTDEEIENMAVGSILHDVGKISISDVILNKPGKLTKEEFEVMKEHTVKGYELLERLSQMHNHPSYIYAMDIARHHHERWDGRGYPDGLKGDQITVWSQVVGIADVYDALVSPRVYKKAFDHDTAVQMIQNGECGQFSPKLLRCFLQVEGALRKLYEPVEQGGVRPQVVPVAESSREPGTSRELIDTLMLTMAVKSAYDMIISVNLTRNSYYMIDYERFRTHCADADGVFDDLIEAGAQSIPESHRQEFVDTFCRESLLKAHAAGKRSVSLDHPQYSDDGRLMDLNTTVLFMEDPRNGDIREITLSRYRGGGNRFGDIWERSCGKGVSDMREAELNLAGVDVKDMMARFMNNEKLAKMIVGKFVQDGTYGQLCQAIAQGDMKAAEFACHTLKGICGNLSLKVLFGLLQEQLCLFRNGEAERAAAMMEQISQVYEDAMVHLKLWLAEA